MSRFGVTCSWFWSLIYVSYIYLYIIFVSWDPPPYGNVIFEVYIHTVWLVWIPPTDLHQSEPAGTSNPHTHHAMVHRQPASSSSAGSRARQQAPRRRASSVWEVIFVVVLVVGTSWNLYTYTDRRENVCIIYPICPSHCLPALHHKTEQRPFACRRQHGRPHLLRMMT